MAEKDENKEVQLDLALPGDDAAAAKREKQVEIEVASEEGASSNDDAIADLRRQLEAEKNGRLDAERRAREASQTAHQATNETHNANFQLVSGAIDRFRGEQEVLKANYRNALAAGDHDAAADINFAISENAAKMLQLQNGKQAMEQEAEQRRQQPVHSDPVEAFVSQLSARSADWVRRHPQFVTDTRLNQKMIAAHNLVVADGHRADSNEYFEALEETLRLKNRRDADVEQNNDVEDVVSAAAAPTARRTGQPPAAPVSRSGNEPGKNARRMVLTPEMREQARNMNQTDEEYAANRAALIKEGRISA
jgi:hypothetical protein